MLAHDDVGCSVIECDARLVADGESTAKPSPENGDRGRGHLSRRLANGHDVDADARVEQSRRVESLLGETHQIQLIEPPRAHGLGVTDES
jgi:hypothetical protein